MAAASGGGEGRRLAAAGGSIKQRATPPACRQHSRWTGGGCETDPRGRRCCRWPKGRPQAAEMRPETRSCSRARRRQRALVGRGIPPLEYRRHRPPWPGEASAHANPQAPFPQCTAPTSTIPHHFHISTTSGIAQYMIGRAEGASGGWHRSGTERRRAAVEVQTGHDMLGNCRVACGCNEWRLKSNHQIH